MGKSTSDSRSRRTTKNKRAMKLAISVLFLAAASTGAPSVGLRRTMPTGHAGNTLAENQKQTAMKIQNKVTPWIQHLEQILKLSIERQHNETSQLYKYIDDSIAHATSEVVKRITDLKENTDESLKALEENMKENLNSLKTITDDNNEKIIENTVNSNNSALALSLDWTSKRMDATEDILHHHQASRSIAIHLNEGDTVKLAKEDTRDQHAPHASSDLFITFCVSMKHLDAALNLDSATVARPSAPPIDLESWSFKEPTLSTIAPPAEIETLSPPSRLPMINADTTPTPSSTRPPCIAGALKNC